MTRVVLLGASNLAISFPSIVRWLAAGLPRPLSLFAAFGHGRSYCTWSRILFRSLPSIDRCGLWADLDCAAQESPGQTLALLTDVGNDLIYGSAPEVIARRVEECLSRLAAQDARIIMTRLPLASIERLSAFRFYATKSVFFPRAGGNWPTMLRSARQVDEALCQMASRFSAGLIDQPLEWYGFDPIHVRVTRRRKAWQTIFAGWPAFQPLPSSKLSQLDAMRLRLAAPADRRLFGRNQKRPQPVFTRGDVSIHLY